MKRASGLLAALTPLTVGIGIAAANASATAAHPSISLSAPSKLPPGVNFRVTASGQALSKGATFIGVVLIWNDSGCPSSVGAAENYPSSYHFVFRNGQGIGAKVSGSYHLNTEPTKWEGGQQKAYLCGYLGGAHQSIYHTPLASAQRVIKFK